MATTQQVLDEIFKLIEQQRRASQAVLSDRGAEEYKWRMERIKELLLVLANNGLNDLPAHRIRPVECSTRTCETSHEEV